jgi:hypothetical protein
MSGSKSRRWKWLLVPLLLVGGCAALVEINNRRDSRFNLPLSARENLYFELWGREDEALRRNMASTLGDDDAKFQALHAKSKDAIRGDLATRYKITREQVDLVREEGLAKKWITPKAKP